MSGGNRRSNAQAADSGAARRHDVERWLALDWPPANWHDVTVMVAVSGGGDSLALLRALHAIRKSGPGRLVAAHFNHRLRPSADADAQFVRQTCQHWNIELLVGQDDHSPTSAASDLAAADEATARRRRYRFLRSAVHKMGARYLATAHTSDDQAETILHRILRGTGLQGLQGIPRLRRLTSGCALIRPLLGISRQQLRLYLEQIGQACREDPTNEDLRYTRNRIRHELLPDLARSYNRNVADALLRLGRLAGDAERALQVTVEGLSEHCVSVEGSQVRVVCPVLASADGYLVRRLFMLLWQQQDWPRQGMAMQHWDELAGLVALDWDVVGNAEFGGRAVSRMLPGAVRATRIDDVLLLIRLGTGGGPS